MARARLRANRKPLFGARLPKANAARPEPSGACWGKAGAQRGLQHREAIWSLGFTENAGFLALQRCFMAAL